MTQTALKKELHKAIDDIQDEKILEAIYTLLNAREGTYDYILSDKDLHILEEQEALYKVGKLKTYSVKAIKKKVMKNLSK